MRPGKGGGKGGEGGLVPRARGLKHVPFACIFSSPWTRRVVPVFREVKSPTRLALGLRGVKKMMIPMKITMLMETSKKPIPTISLIIRTSSTTTMIIMVVIAATTTSTLMMMAMVAIVITIVQNNSWTAVAEVSSE